jgi:arsenic resistance protein ArsH
VEAGRILKYMGAEVKFYGPYGTSTYDFDRSAHHPKVKELRHIMNFMKMN